MRAAAALTSSCCLLHQEVTTAHLRINRAGCYFHADCAPPLATQQSPSCPERGAGGKGDAASASPGAGPGDSDARASARDVDDEGEAWVTVATAPVRGKPLGADAPASRQKGEGSEADDAQLARAMQWKEYGEAKDGTPQGNGAVEAAGGHEGSAFGSMGRRAKPAAGGSWRGASEHNAKMRRCDDLYDKAVASAVMGVPRMDASASRDSGRQQRSDSGRAVGGGGSGEEQSAGGRPLSPACGGEGYQLPADYRDKWDSHHVRMPCSRRNMSSATQSWRWLKIRQALSPHNGFRDTGALIDAIKGYMGKPKQSNPKKWTFRALKSLVDEYYGPREKARFFQETLPFIIESALALPHRCPEPISLLRAGRTAGVNLTSLQIVSLLANGFLCTFPEDTRAQAAAERKFPRFNFYMLFEAPEKRWNREANPVKQHIQKLLCIIHYFERQAARSDAELARSIVTFHRRSHEHGRSWERSTTRIGSVTLQVDAQGRIEDVDPTGADVWEADFANRVIGGGVLGSGCVQEEIRFLLSPELIASLLLTERMGDLESVLITGSERFSKYTGYADTFEFGGDFVDEAIKDVVGTADATAGALSAAEFRRKTTVVAMDALYFRNEQRPYASQFQATWIRRELDKALVAFQPRDAAGDGGDDSGVCGGKVAPWIATGNWGCGAFGGDPILKAVIQIVAAAEAGRNLKYLTFGDEALSKNIGELYGVMCDGDDGEGCTVRQLWLALEQFRLSRESRFAPVGGEELRSFLLGLQWSNLRPGHGQGSGAGVGGGSSAMVSSAHGQERRVAHGSIVVSDDEEVDRGVDEGPDCVVSKRARGEIATSPRREEALAEEAAGSPKERRQEEQDLGGQQDEASPKRVCGVP